MRAQFSSVPDTGVVPALIWAGHCVRSGPAAEVLQGAQGAVVAERRRRQGDDDPGRLDRRSVGMEDMRWAGTHDGGRLQRDVGQFRYNTRQAQHLGQDCAGREQFQGKLRGLLSAHTSGCAEGAETLGSEKLQHTVAEWTPVWHQMTVGKAAWR